MEKEVDRFAPKFRKFPKFNIPTDGKKIKFKIGLHIASKAFAMDVAHNYGLYQGKPIRVDENGRKWLVVKCKEGCPFYLRVSLDIYKQVWKVRRLDDIHTCPTQFMSISQKGKHIRLKEGIKYG